MKRGRWSLVVAAGCVLLTVGMAGYTVGRTKASSAGAEVVRAKRFELVDSKGQAYAVLAFQPNLALETMGPGLALHDAGGRIRALLSLNAGGNPSLRLWDEGGGMRAVLGSRWMPVVRGGPGRREGLVLRCAESSLMLFDGEGELIWEQGRE